jgi:hypothetical protein
MRVLFLPFFVIILLIKTSPAILALFIKKLLPHRSLIISFLILSISSIILVTSISTPLEKVSNLSTKTELIDQKIKLENLLSKQPTHRDILLNLAKINQTLGDEEQALNYKNQALKIDPNNSSL